MPTPREIAEAAFGEIEARHPALTMRIDRSPEHLDLAMDVAVQDGLRFDVALNLQNLDELHLEAGGLWASWFPCTEPRVVREFVEAVSGLLDGRFRILEYRRWGRLVKACLQRPNGSKWRTVRAYYNSWPFSWFCTEVRLLQNFAG